jgi:type 1 glutamine amidotransferase
MSKPAVILAALGLAAQQLGAADAPPAKIVLLGHKLDHPYGSHMYLHECGLLAKCLRQSPGVQALVSDGWPTNAATLQGVNALVLYTSPGGTILLEPTHRAQAEQLLARGVGYVAIHWATDAREDLGPAYLDVLGGWFNTRFSGLNTTTTRLEQLDKAHPICRGWPEYELHDEIYLNLKFHPDARPLLKVKVKDQEQVVAWTFERPGGGRSFGTTLGHFHRNFGLEPFRRMLVNGILWAARRDVPAGGAPVQISDDDLKLPPDPREKK